MNHQRRIDMSQGNPIENFPRLRPTLFLLWRHYRIAEAAREDAWEFAVFGAALRSVGATPDDLRWLIDAQYVDYATLSDPPPKYVLNDHSPDAPPGQGQLYVLTETGAAVMRQISSLVE